METNLEWRSKFDFRLQIRLLRKTFVRTIIFQWSVFYQIPRCVFTVSNFSNRVNVRLNDTKFNTIPGLNEPICKCYNKYNTFSANTFSSYCIFWNYFPLGKEEMWLAVLQFQSQFFCRNVYSENDFTTSEKTDVTIPAMSWIAVSKKRFY